MAKIDDGGTAFPGASPGHCGTDGHAEPCGCYVDSGMSLRDYFADIANKLELCMVRMGFDFETFGGRKVRYKGSPDEPTFLWVPVGTVGEILYTVPRSYAEVQVRWCGKSMSGAMNPCFGHRWIELELLPQEN